MKKEIKDKINSLGLPLTSAQWSAIDQFLKDKMKKHNGELCHICKRPKDSIGCEFCSYPHPISRQDFEAEIEKLKG